MRSDVLNSTGAIWPLGVPVAQSWREIGAHLIAIHELGVRAYLEIGVHRGGLASLLIARSIVSPLVYAGIEIKPDDIDPAVGQLLSLSGRASVTIGDVFATPWLAETLARVPRPALVLCDGGNKPRELALAAPLLRRGDYVMAHDYGREVFDDDLPAGLERLRPTWLAETALVLLRRAP